MKTESQENLMICDSERDSRVTLYLCCIPIMAVFVTAYFLFFFYYYSSWFLLGELYFTPNVN